MKIYARIENSRVAEIIQPAVYEIDAPEFVSEPIYNAVGEQVGETTPPHDWPVFHAGEEVPIEKRFTPEFVATMVDVTDTDVEVGYSYVDGQFAPYVPPPPKPADILAANTAARDALLAMATARIAPLQDAVDLGEATAQEEAALLAWKRFRINVNRIDLTLQEPDWPAAPN